MNTAAAPRYGYPLSLWTYDETLRNKLNSVIFVSSKQGAVSAPAEITFEYSDGDIAATKTFKFDHTDLVSVETRNFERENVSAIPVAVGFRR